MDILSIAKHYYCFADPKDAIPVCDIALNIINSIGNEGFLVSYSEEAYSDLANAYAKLKDKDSVIANMKAAFKAVSYTHLWYDGFGGHKAHHDLHTSYVPRKKYSK